MTRIPPPIATDAGTAEQALGPCTLCQRAILAGERHAQLVPSGRKAHLPCIAAAARPRHARPVIR